METNKRILLYGNSLILGSIKDSLRRFPQFEVTTLLPPTKEKQKLDAAKTDIILFDLETTHPESVFSLLEINPTLQLIGISPGINLVKVWSLRELREVSTQDLVNVIKGEVKDSPAESGCDEGCSY